jgi:hypothetical protein
MKSNLKVLSSEIFPSILETKLRGIRSGTAAYTMSMKSRSSTRVEQGMRETAVFWHMMGVAGAV